MATVQHKRITLDDLLQRDDSVEIIGGEWVKMAAAGGSHQLIALNILRALDDYVTEREWGVVFQDGMTYLMNSLTTDLADSFVPDVSFIHKDNIPAQWDIDKPFPGVPDLAVEVISPNDRASVVQRKLRTYLDGGTAQVWLVYPATKEVHQHLSGTPEEVRVYKGVQAISAGDLLPDLQLTTAQIFKLPKWALDAD